jgi:hypothetical protein
LLDRADHDALPVLGSAYKDIHSSHEQHGVFHGFVVSIATSTFSMTYDDRDHDTDDGSWTVQPPSGFAPSSLVVGDRVIVAGDARERTVRAYGIEKF